MPFVSVLMPCYNAERFLQDAINSIINQTFTDFELLIIDDCSCDGSLEIINRFCAADQRIVLIQNSTNSGVVEALNRGIKLTKGQFIARMDADDISHPQRLEKQIDYMIRHPECIVCGTNIRLINETGKRIGMRSYFTENRKIKHNILLKSPFAHPSVMIRKQVLIENNLSYSQKYGSAEDYYLWMRLFDLGLFANLDEFLFDYRITSTSIKSRYAKETLFDTIRLKIDYRSHANLKAILILSCECALYLFPKRVIIFLFISLQKLSLVRLGKEHNTK
jgi:glycosyltransferase involved in cell wall biosynthesis